MDFLDPKAKRNHIIRLVIGYGLMAVLIGIATFILVFQAYGFDVDRKTGEVIQNGLVFVDSAPDDASIKFNGQEQKEKTNNRFALPSGQYSLQITKSGYRDWNSNFALDGGEVERFTYPLLIPSDLKKRDIQTYDAAPTFVTESPDRRWVIMNQSNSLTNFIEYDLNSLTDEKPKERQFKLPSGLFTAAAGNHTLELVEWSNDNKHALVKHASASGVEFVIISRDQPNTSVNINKHLGQSPTKVVLRYKKFDQWYLYTETGGVLQSADLKKAIAPILTGVTAFKTHDDKTILYSQMLPDGKTQRVTLKDDKESYTVKETVSPLVYLDIAKYDDSWYVAVGADAEQKTYIYRDPVNILQKKDGTKPTPRSILKAKGPMSLVSFSQNTRFIVTQSGQYFEVFDAEYNQTYKFDVPKAFDPGTKVVWMDGHRLLARSQSKAVIVDFDGSNIQELVPSLASAPLMFDRDYTVIYNVEGAANAPGKFLFRATDLRLEEDK